MALDENLKKVPLTGDFALRSSGEVYLKGLVADASLALSSNNDITDVTPESGAEPGVEEGTNVYSVALFDSLGGLIKSTKVLYDNDGEELHAPSITSYATDSLKVSGNATILGDLTVSGDTILSSIIIDVSALSSLSISGNNYIKGDLNVTGDADIVGDINVSGDVYVRDDLFVLDTLKVDNHVSAFSGLTVSGSVSSLGSVLVSGSVIVTGNHSVTGDVTVTGATNLRGEVSALDKLIVDNHVSALSGLSVSGDTTLSGGLTVNNHVSALSNLSILGEVSALDKLIVNNQVSALSGVSVSGNLIVTGGSRIGIGTEAPGQVLDVAGDTAGGAISVRVQNEDNTSVGSDARYIAKVAGTSGGDPHMRFMIQGGQSWCLGLANGASDNFRIADANNLDSGIAMEIDASENVWMPLSLAVGQSAAADNAAVLELESTTKVFLPPRMTTTQRDLITPPAGGVIYNTTTNVLNFYNGSAWGAV
jgi:predicted acyltransferase (DUF342 family)